MCKSSWKYRTCSANHNFVVVVVRACVRVCVSMLVFFPLVLSFLLFITSNDTMEWNEMKPQVSYKTADNPINLKFVGSNTIYIRSFRLLDRSLSHTLDSFYYVYRGIVLCLVLSWILLFAESFVFFGLACVWVLSCERASMCMCVCLITLYAFPFFIVFAWWGEYVLRLIASNKVRFL